MHLCGQRFNKLTLEHLVTLTWDTAAAGAAGEMKAFIDGSQVGSTQIGLGTWSGEIDNSVSIGSQGASSHAFIFDGMIDEVRVSNTPRSADWIKASYLSQKQNGTFATFGIAEGTSTPDIDPPTTPGDLTATAVSGTQIDLSWTASTDNVGVAGYNIYRDGNLVGASTNTSLSDMGLDPNTTYGYSVAAFDAAGNMSALSTPVSATTLSSDTEAPTPPVGLMATAVNVTQIDLNWMPSTDNVGVTGYNIYRDGNLVGTSAITDFSDTGLKRNKTYEYTVAAFDAAGNLSPQSESAFATTPRR